MKIINQYDDTIMIVKETDVYLQYVKLKLHKDDALELLILEQNVLKKKMNQMIKCIRTDVKNSIINETNGIRFINYHLKDVFTSIVDLKTFVQYSLNNNLMIFEIKEYFILFEYLQDTIHNLGEIMQYIIVKCLKTVSF